MPITGTPISTVCRNWEKVYATNTTQANFSAKTDTATEPTGDGVVDCVTGGGPSGANTYAIQFFGTDADNETGLVRVYGLSPITKAGTSTVYWHYTPLFSGTFTLNSTLTGVANGPVVATEYYADTLTRTVGVENVGDSILSPGDATGPATLLVDAKGFHKLFVDLTINGSTTNVNALVKGV